MKDDCLFVVLIETSFCCNPRQLGRSSGLLVDPIACTSFFILKNYIIHAAEQFGRDFVESAVPHIGDVVSGKTNIKKALKKFDRKHRKVSDRVKKQLEVEEHIKEGKNVQRGAKKKKENHSLKN